MQLEVNAFKSTQEEIEGFREAKTQYFLQFKKADGTQVLTMNVGKLTYDTIKEQNSDIKQLTKTEGAKK